MKKVTLRNTTEHPEGGFLHDVLQVAPAQHLPYTFADMEKAALVRSKLRAAEGENAEILLEDAEYDWLKMRYENQQWNILQDIALEIRAKIKDAETIEVQPKPPLQ